MAAAAIPSRPDLAHELGRLAREPNHSSGLVRGLNQLIQRRELHLSGLLRRELHLTEGPLDELRKIENGLASSGVLRVRFVDPLARMHATLAGLYAISEHPSWPFGYDSSAAGLYGQLLRVFGRDKHADVAAEQPCEAGTHLQRAWVAWKKQQMSEASRKRLEQARNGQQRQNNYNKHQQPQMIINQPAGVLKPKQQPQQQSQQQHNVNNPKNNNNHSAHANQNHNPNQNQNPNNNNNNTKKKNKKHKNKNKQKLPSHVDLEVQREYQDDFGAPSAAVRARLKPGELAILDIMGPLPLDQAYDCDHAVVVQDACTGWHSACAIRSGDMCGILDWLEETYTPAWGRPCTLRLTERAVEFVVDSNFGNQSGLVRFLQDAPAHKVWLGEQEMPDNEGWLASHQKMVDRMAWWLRKDARGRSWMQWVDILSQYCGAHLRRAYAAGDLHPQLVPGDACLEIYEAYNRGEFEAALKRVGGHDNRAELEPRARSWMMMQWITLPWDDPEDYEDSEDDGEGDEDYAVDGVGSFHDAYMFWKLGIH